MYVYTSCVMAFYCAYIRRMRYARLQSSDFVSHLWATEGERETRNKRELTMRMYNKCGKKRFSCTLHAIQPAIECVFIRFICISLFLWARWLTVLLALQIVILYFMLFLLRSPPLPHSVCIVLFIFCFEHLVRRMN